MNENRPTIHVVGHGIEITPALKTYIEKKLIHYLEREGKTETIHVVLTTEHHRVHHVEATVHSRHGVAHAKASAEDMYAAIDLLEDKLSRQLVRQKEKHADHHPERRGGNGAG